MYLEQALDIEILDKEAESIKTLNDLIAFLQKKVELIDLKIHSHFDIYHVINAKLNMLSVKSTLLYEIYLNKDQYMSICRRFRQFV